MIDDRPDETGVPQPSQKLLLPGPAAAYSPPDQRTQYGNALPEHFTHSRLMPTPALPPYAVKKRSWRNDPAYIVLLAAICAVLIAGIAFAVVANSLFFSSTTQNAKTALKAGTTPQGTVDTQPIFPTPDGHSGGGTPVNQPLPTATSIPTATPTTVTIVQPTPTQTQNTQLTVQINNPPKQVFSNAVVPISVTTSEANTSIKLVVFYSVSPYLASFGPQTTDANGNGTISWPVTVRAFEQFNSITARILIVARDQNKEEALSQTFLVQIIMRGIIFNK
ncbi:MAG: hypothetical protein NVSMB49_11170 [Ktedonobacteraceae bacterium]